MPPQAVSILETDARSLPPQQDEARLNKVLAYRIASIRRCSAPADLRAGIELRTAPGHCERKLVSREGGQTGGKSSSSHASLFETLAGLKAAVAMGGIDCETVVLADWAAARATKADATESVDSMPAVAQARREA